MSLSKYPEKLDMFELKRNAAFAGDPNGDNVMAEDINELQDAILAIEKSLGVNPQGNKLTVGERVTLLEGSSSLRVPSFLLYLGVPEKINGATTSAEAIGHFVKYDHVVLGANADDINDPDHQITKDIIDGVKANRDVKFYGYMDCGVSTTNLEVSELQVKIQSWKDMGATGIYCGNFGFESGVSRERQNEILDLIHQHGIVAVIQAANPDEVFSDVYHETLNPEWTKPNIQEGDTYHFDKFVVDTSTTAKYTNFATTISTLNKLYDYRRELGIRIFATPVIRTDVAAATAQNYYDYAHVAALLTSVDAFHPVVEGYGASINTTPSYAWWPIAGNWYVSDPVIDVEGSVYSRETAFGKLVIDATAKTFDYQGLYIPYKLLQIAANTIEGNLIKDGTIEDKKIQSYKGERLIDSINADTGTHTINIEKIERFGAGDLDPTRGSISVDILKANVIEAINANIGFATIGGAIIRDLHADQITAGTIDADRITASVVHALNLYAENMEVGSAKIGQAVIGDLSADKITAGTIDADRITASVVDAINLSAQQANIQNLNADNITAGNIKAERIAADVVNAINLYTDNMVAGSATINTASIGELTAGHIRASVIEAVNLSSDTATINSAKIGTLTADKITGAVVEAINLNAGTATINQAVIGDLSATKITTGTLDADIIKGSVIEAINFTSQSAVIDQARIGNLHADKITAGDISAERIQSNIITAIDMYAQNMTAESAKINNAAIGTLDAGHIKGAVVEAINLSAETATISNAKIGELEVDNMKAAVIAAVNASLETATIGQAKIGDLSAEKIKTGTLEAERIKSSVIEAINGSFENLTINNAKIGTLSVDNMKAAVIEAVNASISTAKIGSAAIGELSVDNMKANTIAAINASIETATIDAAQIGVLTADHIKASVLEAINFHAGTATINTAVIGNLTVDNMKVAVVEAINSYTGVAVIGEAKIGNLSAQKITTGDIAAERMTANAIKAINADISTATIDAAQIGSLKAGNIQAEVISAINASLETATIGNAKIGALGVDNLKASVIEAVNASISTATIDSAKIGTLSADKMKTNILEAINAYVGTATIDQAKIGVIDASKITTGDLSVERLKAHTITAINASLETATIDSARIGALTADKIQASVISAINANIGTATINKAVIPELDADHIETNVIAAINANITGTAKIESAVIGNLSADKIQASVIAAINANIGTATINKAVIPELDATHIASSVVEAINLKTTSAVIEQGRIGNLDAGKITTGDISADRMKTNVITAVNADISAATIDSAQIGSLSVNNMKAAAIEAVNASISTATINAAKIGSLAVDNIKASVIEAVNASISTATINSAKIGALTADKIQASVIEALEANVGTATINEALIGSLNADKIVGGNISADVMKATVIGAVNASIEEATINSAKIGALTADKIQASVISAINANIGTATIDKAIIPTLDAGHIQANVISAINGYIGTATINSAKIGNIAAEKIEASVIEAINANIDIATIDQAVIPKLTSQHIEATVIDAINTQITGRAVINEASIGNLSAAKITSGDIAAERMTTNAIAAINADISSATIDAAQIGSLTATNIQAEVIKAINASIESVTIGSGKIGTLSVDNMTASVISAINASIESAKIGSARIGTLTADHIKASVIDAINLTTQTAVIDQGRIGNLDATKITAGDISADRMKANAVSAINADIGTATINSAKIGALTADKIQASVIAAIDANIGTATINKAIIPELDATHIDASVIQAINANISGTAKIESAVIGTLDANVMATNIISAINANIGSATIDKAIIPELDAGHISTNVIAAVNAAIGTATIDQAKIGVLDAAKITSGQIGTDRLTANVVTAINSELQTAKINNAKIGNLTAGHIQAVAIEAINGRIDNATINSAKIGALTADKIQAAVIEAINANIGSATINSAKIGTLDADKMRTNVLEAINFHAGTATINEALIATLNASKINAGDIAAERMTANAIKAINADITSATIDAAQIGSLKAGNIQAEIIQAINASIETATIDAAQIGVLKAENIAAEIVKAINLSSETAQIGSAKIGNLDASKITSGQIATGLLTANVVHAINSVTQTAQIAEAKIADLNAGKITAGDIHADRMKTNVVTAVNAYVQAMTAGSAKIDSAAIGTLNADHMQAKVISAINASIETINGNNAVINNAKIGTLTSDHIKGSVVEAINLNATSAVISQGKIGNLDAGKITTGSIHADRMKTNVISAINADITTATIDAAQIGALSAGHIEAEVIEAINTTTDTATINSAKIGDLTVGHIDAVVISAINASLESATINSARIGTLTADKIKATVIEAINTTTDTATINSARIGELSAGHIDTVVISAINASLETAKIGAAKIGVLEADNIKAGSIDATKISVAGLRADQITSGYIHANRIEFGSISGDHIAAGEITSDHIVAGTLKGDRIEAGTLSGDRMIAGTLDASFIKAGTITSELISAGGITARNIAAGSITADMIQAGTISANHISTKGLDAQTIQVYNGKTGEVLIGSGYLRVDGLDVGVVQSDNLAANGAFMTSSSAYGYLRDNPTGEAVLGGKSEAPGAHQLWKVSLADGTVYPIDLGAKKPVDFAIDTDGTFGYVTMQGNDTLVQVDLANNTRTGVTLPMGKGPGRLYFNGDTLMDMKHFMVLSTDPDDVNIPDSLIVVDAPPSSIDQALYNHHVIPLGNKPYDVVTSNKHITYVTLAEQGDIAVLEMTNVNSMNWKPVRNIPIAAYMTDNYHGGMPGNVGLNEVTGGDSASQYDTNMAEMDMPGHVHGGYGVTDGTLITYEPHGLSLSTDPQTLYVADYANGFLVIVDTEGKAPYNALSGSRQAGNLGTMGIPPNMGPNKPENPPTTGEPTGYVPPPEDEVHAHAMNTEEPVFEAKMGDMDMGTDVTTDGGRAFTKDQTQHTTNYVRYRIPVGDSPEFVKLANGYIFITVEGSGKVAFIKEEDILNKITWDRWYYTNYDEFTEMAPLPNFTVGQINVGSRPSHMHFCETTNRLFVTVNGQNQVVVIDTTALATATNPDDAIVQRINVGANPKGIQVDANGQYMYVVNHGGTGNLSFVYPENGPFIGDPYIGLEGGVEYQGADQWVPMRSNWVRNLEDDVVAGSTVEFHINEPFLNEGGYVKLTAYNDGNDAQYAYIEQDIVNVTNYSNGDNIRHITGEILKANETLTLFTPEYPWLQDPGVTNVKIMGTAKNETLTRQADNKTFTAANKWLSVPQPPTFTKVLADGTQLMVDDSTYTITYPTTDAGVAKVVFNATVEAGANIIVSTYNWWKTATGYTVEYNNGANIRFDLGVIKEGEWVVADYTHRYNLWFKPHNGSIAVAVEQGTTDNFYTKFEIDEFVPKFVTYDNLQTEPFVYSPIAKAGTNANYDGIEYSMMTNRALDAVVTSSAIPVAGTYDDIIDGKEPDDTQAEHAGHTMSVGEPVFTPMHAFGTEVQFPGGLQWVKLDLGKLYMIGKVVVMHSFHKRRKYHGTKTQVSEDGVTWTTVFDSAVSGEYMEFVDDGAGNFTYGNHIEFSTRPVRYIRDYANGYTEYTQDPITLEYTVATEYADNYWTEIKAYGDWEFDTSYLNDDETNMATNGRGLVTTDVTDAYASIDIPIDFTSKWYVTYLIGPEFGMADVEMSSMMGMSHALTQDSPVLTKFQHKHVMYWPPSTNVKADPMMNVKAGKHRATIRQRSGRINIDRFRFEDFQYFDRNSQIITADKSATFRRTKIVPTQAQWYVGDAIQSSEGAYDTPRLNPDTGQPDYSVPIKYRMRFRTDLSAGATLPDGSKKPGRGIAYATSAIFETGKLSSHWRMSSAADFIPGTRIEAWDANHPHKTGIQHHHLANGAVKGNKIYPLSIMDHHVSPYANIQESKLKLNHPTHRHGMPIMAEVMPGMMMEVGFHDNTETLDSIMGWGDSGTSTNMARADHNHDDKYVLKGQDGAVTNLSVTGDITVTGTVDGVDVSGFKTTYDTHVGSSGASHAAVTTTVNGFMTAADKVKLNGISTGANKTTSSTVNGNIKVDGVETTVYTHPTGDANLHVPATGTGNNGKFLKAGATAGSISWQTIVWNDIASKPATFAPPIATASVLGGVKIGGGISVDANGVISWAHATGDGNLHVPATGTTNNGKFLKAGSVAGSLSWAQMNFTDVSGTITDAQHGQRGGGNLHAVATTTTPGFMSAEDKSKMDNIQASAINQTTADARYLQLTGGTITGDLTVNGVLNMGSNETSQTTMTFDGTTAASLRVANDFGYIQLTPINTGWAHIYTDRSNFIFNKTVYNIGGGGFSSYTAENLLLKRAGTVKLTLEDLRAVFVNNVVAPKFIKTDGTEVSYVGHIHANATSDGDGFMSKLDKAKLDGIQAGAINQATADARYLQINGDGSVAGNLSVENALVSTGIEIGKRDAVETPYIDLHSSGVDNDYDVRLQASGGTAGVNGQGALTVEAATFAVRGDITLTGTVDGVDLAAFKNSYDLHTAAPAAPTGLTLVENDDYVTVTFATSSTVGVGGYEIWSSLGNNTSYKLITTISKDDIGAATGVTYEDRSYDRKTTVYYKVYAVKDGTRSAALTNSIVLAENVIDPTNLLIIDDIDSFTIEYDIPEDRRLDKVEIWVDKDATTTALSEATATLVYSGRRESYVYRIPEADYDLYHQFWVKSITRV